MTLPLWSQEETGKTYIEKLHGLNYIMNPECTWFCILGCVFASIFKYSTIELNSEIFTKMKFWGIYSILCWILLLNRQLTPKYILWVRFRVNHLLDSTWIEKLWKSISRSFMAIFLPTPKTYNIVFWEWINEKCQFRILLIRAAVIFCEKNELQEYMIGI